MSRQRSAMPFAKAVFDVARATNRTAEIGDELGRIADLVGSHADLSRALTHPAVPARTKRSIVDRVAAAADLSAPVQKLLALMADRDLLGALPELHRAYQARLLQHAGVVEAHVTAAAPMPDDRVQAIAQGLARATGKEVRVTTAVDPALMGGVVARIGSKVFDGSVRRQLERLRERLVEA